MTESDNHPEVTEDGADRDAAGDRSTARRSVSILPWEAAESPADPPAGGGVPPARTGRPTARGGRPPARRPIPPSGLLASPGPGSRTGSDDPFAALPPWLPPVRRPVPGGPNRPAQSDQAAWRDGRADSASGRPALPPGRPGPPRPPLGTSLTTPPAPRRPPEPWSAADQRTPFPWVADSPATLPPATRSTGPTAPPEHSAPARSAVSETVPQAARSGTKPTTTGAKPTAPKPIEPKPIEPKPIDIGAKRTAKSAAAKLAAAKLPAAKLASPNPAGSNLAGPNLTGPKLTGPKLAGSNLADAGRTALAGVEPPTTNASRPPLAAVTPQTDAPAPVPALPEPAPAEVAPRRRLTADSIVHERIVRPDQRIPTVGWRAALYAATGGRINLGIGAAERDWLELLARVRRPMAGARQIAVTSIKGGVGKTTVAACLGLMLAEYRGDGVVAVDADPDAGTLADRLGGQVSVTVRDLLADVDKISSLGQIGEYTSLAGRLRVLAGEQDPAMGEAFRREEYQRVCGALARFFDIVITDSGTGLVHSAMRGTLELADRLIVVGSPTVDGASRASKTLDWLLAHGHERLVEDAVLVLCQDRSSHRVDHAQLHRHFTERCKHVVEIPADPHLYSGGLIDPSLLQPITRDAYLRLAAVVGDGFSR